MKNTLSNALHEIITALDYPETNIVVQLPKNPEHGDFATNLAMQLGEKLGKNPRDIAQILAEKLIENYQKNKNPQKFIDDSCLSGEKPKALLKKIQYLIQGHGWHFCMYNKTSIIALFKRHGFQNIRVIPAGETMIPLPDGLDLNVHENNSLYLEANI